jgi:transcriptional regulator with XRE-family HTH domain
MPEIGETLRETRMRRRIDMTEVEAATKIRAKYLRALENEEWDLLPGPTFVKTFLRTYAEYLDLDPRLLVEEYRQRYERPSSQDLTPFGPGLGGQRRRRRQRPRRNWGPAIAVLAGIVVLLAALYGLSLLGGGEDDANPPVATTTPRPSPTPAKQAKQRRKRRPAAPTRATLRLIATATVYVCLEDASGKAVLNGVTLAPGKASRTFRSRRFRANFGNGGVRMRVNGHSYRAADTGNPIGYQMRPTGRPRKLSEAARAALCT